MPTIAATDKERIAKLDYKIRKKQDHIRHLTAHVRDLAKLKFWPTQDPILVKELKTHSKYLDRYEQRNLEPRSEAQ